MSWAYASSAGTLLLVSVLTHPSGGDPAGLVGVLNHLSVGGIGEEEINNRVLSCKKKEMHGIFVAGIFKTYFLQPFMSILKKNSLLVTVRPHPHLTQVTGKGVEVVCQLAYKMIYFYRTKFKIRCPPNFSIGNHYLPSK